jgi:hypothetical protein
MQFLDSTEAAAWMDAFALTQGRHGSATFTDPWDGSAATAVRQHRDELTVTQTGEERFGAQVTLAEERE